MATPGEDVYATLLLGDSYLPGALVLAHSLRDAGTRKKLAVLVTTDNVSANVMTELRSLYDYVIPVERVINPLPANLFLMDRPDLQSAFTKITLWKQLQFRRVIYMDADMVALRAPDELFNIPKPFSAAPDIGWPDLFNTGFMVLTPNMGDYYALLAMAQRGISFDGADQGLLNMHFKDSYNRISFTYNVTPSAHYQYIPAYKHFQSSISAAHFIGKEKPWTEGRDAIKGSGPHDELVGRWWAVYDRHYREPAAVVSGQGLLSVVQHYVKGEDQPRSYGYSSSQQSLPAETRLEILSKEPFTAKSFAREPLTTEPFATKPFAKEPLAKEPLAKESFAKESFAREPFAREPFAKESFAKESFAKEPFAAEPFAAEPFAAELFAAEPFSTESFAAEPFPAEPFAKEPFPAEPFAKEPFSTEPFAKESFPAEPFRTEPLAAEPFTTKSLTIEPLTIQPFAAETLTTKAFTTETFAEETSTAETFTAALEAPMCEASDIMEKVAEEVPVQTTEEKIDEKVEEKGKSSEKRDFITPYTAWNPARGPPPSDSKPEASNFPATHYEMSSDRTPFKAPEKYPEPPQNMYYEVPKTPTYQKPTPIFPWETDAPKPTRVFPEDNESLHLSRSESAVTDEKDEPVTPAAPITSVLFPDIWASFNLRGNAWDDIPEIERYIGALQKNRKGNIQVLQGYGSGIPHTSSPGGRRPSMKLTDFPTELERPSLPVTPAPVRRPRFWGRERDEEGQLPAAEGVPPQSEWDPVLQLDILARRQSEVLTSKLGDEFGREIPARPLPYGSEGVKSPTYLPLVPPSRVSGQSGIEKPSYAGPNAIWEKGEMFLTRETLLCESEEEQDTLER